MSSSFAAWRRIHFVASGLVTLIAVAHVGLTLPLYRRWSADAVWFFGAGLGVLIVGLLNLTHIGVEPCKRPTARFVRITNWVYAVFGLATLVAVPEPQAYALVAALVAQAVVARRTLPGLA
jgi:hypothetical protein